VRFPEKLCQAHLRRRGAYVPADEVVNGEAMCQDCFNGKELEYSPRRDKLAGRAAPCTPGERTGHGKASFKPMVPWDAANRL
jgi:hypothetical protein